MSRTPDAGEDWRVLAQKRVHKLEAVGVPFIEVGIGLEWPA
ncbi:hypothetical protein [Paraburkholderia diazotrophica]|nr:hypothetical protein [Paraburkholderia diazotrophica]